MSTFLKNVPTNPHLPYMYMCVHIIHTSNLSDCPKTRHVVTGYLTYERLSISFHKPPQDF